MNKADFRSDITLLQLIMAMVIAAGVPLVTAVSPFLLAAKVQEGQLAATQIGQVPMIEFLMMALSTVIISFKARTDRIRVMVMVAVSLFALASLASAFTGGHAFIACRMLAGLCEGFLMWFLIQMFARLHAPARSQGIYMAIQGCVGATMSALFSNLIVPHFGSSAGFAMLAAFSLLGLGCAMWLPAGLTSLPGNHGSTNWPPRLGVIGLLATAAMTSAIIAIWYHIPLLAMQQGRPHTTMGIGLPVTLVVQILGGLAAAALAVRLSYRGVMHGTPLAIIAIALLLLSNPPEPVFITAMALFGFLWMLSTPFQAMYLIHLDPSRRSLVYTAVSQPIGSALGPSLASLAVIGANVTGALLVGMTIMGISLLLQFTSLASFDRKAPEPV